MITYNPGKWSIVFACSLHGSVFPKAFVWAAPCSLFSLCLHIYLHSNENFNKIDAGDVETSVLSGLQIAASLFLRGEWFNAYSSLMAFCNMAPDKQEEVLAFQHRLARLCSLLYFTAIQQVSTTKIKNYELIDMQDFDPKSMEYLIECPDRCEVCLQWIQRLIGEASDSETIKVAPPILSRVYNQLGNGIVNLRNARKITDFPIPFPLAQMITLMLLTRWVSTAFICAASVENSFWACRLTFIVTFSFWSIHYIAVELEQPFGDDANDLPLHDMQIEMNASLIALLDSRAQHPPKFVFGEHHLNLKRTQEDLEVTFGNGKQSQKQIPVGPSCRSLSLQSLSLRSLSLRSLLTPKGSTSSHASNNHADTDLAPPVPICQRPEVPVCQRPDEPAGLIVFSYADDNSAAGSWPRPHVDKEAIATAPAALAPNIAHTAELPLTPTSTERHGRSGQSRHSMLCKSPSTYGYKDQPVPALPSKHAERVAVTTESVSVPCFAAPSHPDCWQLAGKDPVIQRSLDTLLREAQAQVTQPNGWAGLSWRPSEPTPCPNLGIRVFI